MSHFRQSSFRFGIFDFAKILEGVGFYAEEVKKNWPFLRGASCRHLIFPLRGKILIDHVNVGGMDIKWNGPQIINNLVVNKQ